MNRLILFSFALCAFVLLPLQQAAAFISPLPDKVIPAI